MALARLNYAGTDLSPFGFDLQVPDGGSVPYEARGTLGGTKVFGFQNHVDKHDLACSGVLSASLFNTLEALLGTSNTLICSNGTCTAVLTLCIGIPRPGDPGSSGHLVDVTLAFCKTSAFA